MGDILKNISSGWPFLVGWVLPSALYWSIFALFILPSVSALPIFSEIHRTSPANQTLVLAGASLLTGLILNGLSTVLYRILGGYYLPRGDSTGKETLASRMTKRQLTVHRQLSERLLALEKSNPNSLSAGLVREQLQRYPANPAQYGPTAFANAMRAFEYYGWDRYRLDSQTFWSELIAVAPDGLRDEQESARTPIDFSVSLAFLSFATLATCLVAIVAGGWNISVALVGALAACLVPLWYRLAVLNTRYLNSVVRALVNVGRAELATKLGLQLPGTLHAERDMWENLFWMVIKPHEEKYEHQLDEYRLPAKPLVDDDHS